MYQKPLFSNNLLINKKIWTEEIHCSCHELAYKVAYFGQCTKQSLDVGLMGEQTDEHSNALDCLYCLCLLHVRWLMRAWRPGQSSSSACAHWWQILIECSRGGKVVRSVPVLVSFVSVFDCSEFEWRERRASGGLEEVDVEPVTRSANEPEKILLFCVHSQGSFYKVSKRKVCAFKNKENTKYWINKQKPPKRPIDPFLMQ